MAKIQKSLALTVLMSLLVLAAFTAANLFVQSQDIPTPLPTDHPTSEPTGTHHPTSSPTGTHNPTASPTPNQTYVGSPTPTMTTPTTYPTTGVNWNMWGWLIGGLVALLAILIIAWAVYRGRHNRYHHPNQDIHGHTNPEQAHQRQTYPTEEKRQPYTTQNTQRTYSEDINRRPQDTIEKRTTTETDRIQSSIDDTARHQTNDIDKRLFPEDTENT
ncbi:MAG: hypothetical protein LBH79_09365 [Nitrososphaerota archaeon]|jgi:cytoskeletal protein RodZ|nr:hypothetical protein [Nitrososphaerota archaeon]